MNIHIIKKDGNLDSFNFNKIKQAIEKSAERVNFKISDKNIKEISSYIENEIKKLKIDAIPVARMHVLVECALEQVIPTVAKSYRDFRNYKMDFVQTLERLFNEGRGIKYVSDRNNANTDSSLISTQRVLLTRKLAGEIYERYEMTPEERVEIREGYYYIHDKDDRFFTMNCCLFDIGAVLKGGFELANMFYTEPTTISTAMSVIGDIVLSASAQQYGGFTLPEIDTVLEPYIVKSYNKYLNEFDKLSAIFESQMTDVVRLMDEREKYAISKLSKDIEQGFQEWEYKFNTVSSSRGDFAFVTITLGLSTTKLGKLFNKICLKVREEGQGAEGFKKPVLFPKIVFLYTDKLHGNGKELEDVYDAAVECSSKALYPDYLSLDADPHNYNILSDMYHNYGEVISPVGCRAFLSPYWENGGHYKKDENDKPVFVGRWNAGAISLNLPMIYQKSVEEQLDFYGTLDYYLEKIREIHKRTYKMLSETKASSNPLAFTQGGFYRGHLKPSDTIESLMDYVTFSFGITSLNELQVLHNGKLLHEDDLFVNQVLDYINVKVNEFKEKDHIMYALYGTPSESLCGKQVEQFRAKYGVVGEVGKREFFTNSFHMPVWADITPPEKLAKEYHLFHKMSGGHIQYLRYPNGKNLLAIKTLVRRAMALGFYEGVNIEKNYCDDCGEQFDDGNDVCPKCGSSNITQINRVCGYIGFSKVNGDTRMNKAKLAEIKDRISM